MIPGTGPAAVKLGPAPAIEQAGTIAHFAALCEDVCVQFDDSHDRQAARSRIFDAAQTLAGALMACDEGERWEPLRDLILAGLQAGGLGQAEAAGSASGELAAAALDVRRQLAD